jgi:beta-lactamase class A
MIRIYYFTSILVLGGAFSSCQSKKEKLTNEINAFLAKQEGTFAIAFKDLRTGEEILIREHESFHAASTMKTPVMIEVFKQAAEGKFSLNDSILVKNEFKSIADGSTFSLDSIEDSEHLLYKQLGKKKLLSDLVYDMIIVSSNLATNIIIELVDAKNVMETMHGYGAKDMQVLRGVEDDKAFLQGLNNTTMAYDLMLIFEKIAKGEAVSPEASKAMVDILLDQQFNEIIPAQLPKEVKVAHKTGSITSVHHDSGIVYLPDGRKYVLVFLSKGFKEEPVANEAMATVSKMIYQHVID